MVGVKATDQGNLDKQQQVKIRKLLRSADPDHANLALSLLEETGNEHDYRAAFSITVIRKMVNEACEEAQSALALNHLATGVLRAADKGLLAKLGALLEGKASELLLTVPVDDPMGDQSYQCGECNGEFSVDWAEQKLTWER